jgi:hypothetical protein
MTKDYIGGRFCEEAHGRDDHGHAKKETLHYNYFENLIATFL